MIRPTAVLAMVAALVAATTGADAQEHPDLSGTWVVERVEVQAPQGGNRGGGGGPGGFGRGPGGPPPGRGGGPPGRGGGGPQGRGGPPGAMYQKGDRLTLTQSAEALIVTDAGRATMSRHPFDGSEVANPGPDGGTVRSKARWDGVALVVEGSQSMEGPQGTVSIQTRQVWSTSPDGETLTLVSTTRLPFGTASSTVTLSRVAS